MAEPGKAFDELRARQRAFAAHIRDPENQPAPADVDDRRMQVYRELFFNNVANFLGGNFPILRKLLGEPRWRSVVRDYYRDHRSHAPLFPDMPRDFLNYLAEERPAGRCSYDLPDPPFLAELAHYEWVQWGLMLAEDADPDPAIDPDGDLLAGRPAIAEPAWLLSYHWRVNEINKDHQPCSPEEQPIHFLVFRNADDKVVFAKLNNVSARLFDLIQRDSALTGEAALLQIAAELNVSDTSGVITGGRKILEQWRATRTVLGTR